MHILLIHQAFAALDEPGGTRHHELARHLASQGHQVTIIASPVSYLTGTSQDERIPWCSEQDGGPGVRILRAYTYSALHKSFVHRVFSFFSFMFSAFWIGLRVRDVDLIWGTSPPIFQGATAWALAKIKRVPLLFEVRDLWPAFAIAVGVLQNSLLIRLSEGLERFLYRGADRVMVNSPGFIDHVQARGAREVELVPNGADASMFDPQKSGQDFRDQHGLQGKFVALYAGAHGMSNDLGVVLAAADQLRDLSKVAVVLLGDGKEKANLMAQAEAMGLDNLHFLPPVPKTGMGMALAAADACIGILKPIDMYATVYPNKIFDYLAAGRPIVLAMEGVIRDVVEAAEAGIPVPPGDAAALAQAIRTLAEDPHAARRMGMSGRAYIEAHFDRVLLAEKLRDLLEEMAAVGG
jgi:glycosyltransferase involved in cell wall biosynthesis